MSKLNSRYIHAIFCDDVRKEEGGKLSLMGLYQGTLHVSVPSLPVSLPQICVVVEARTPPDEPFQKLKVKILVDEQEVSGGEFSASDLNTAMEANSYRTHGMIFSLQPFVIEKNCILRVRVDTEDGEIKAGGLQILHSPPATAEPLLA